MSEAVGEELSGMWRILAAAPVSGLSSGKISLKMGERHLAAAIDGSGGRHLLVPLPAAPDQSLVWKSAAIRLRRSNLKGENGVAQTWLDLHCSRAELEPVFTRLAAEVIRQLVLLPHEEAQTACVAILEEWRGLFGVGSASENSAIGLIGELLFLEQLTALDPVRAMEAWVGPRGGRHDFRFGSHSVEIKTTTRKLDKIVEIHGLEQMLAPDGGDLHLAFFRLEQVPGGAISIVSLLTKLVGLGVPKDQLLEMVEDSGVKDLAQDLAKMGYELREKKLYCVGESFPRIVPSSFLNGQIPANVLDIAYRIDLSSQAPLDGVMSAKVLDSLAMDAP